MSLIETATAPATRAPHGVPSTINISVDGRTIAAHEGELLVEAILREKEIPHICYHSPLMGPIQTCDTCLVEVDGKLVRSCGTKVSSGMQVVTDSKRAKDARAEAFDVILGNHMLYCTVCDNNNENCRVHNTALALNVQHQEHPFKPKPYEVDMSNPFYRYDPSQCILCGQCVQACQTVEVNETLSIGWELEHPRVLWDGGMQIGGSSCVSCGHCITVCPCNALMEKSMLGEAGFLSGMPKDCSEQDDRCGQSDRARDGLRCDHAGLADRGQDARGAHQEEQRLSAPIAALAAATMSGPRTARSSRLFLCMVMRTRSPPASKASSGGTMSTTRTACRSH